MKCQVLRVVPVLQKYGSLYISVTAEGQLELRDGSATSDQKTPFRQTWLSHALMLSRRWRRDLGESRTFTVLDLVHDYSYNMAALIGLL